MKVKRIADIDTAMASPRWGSFRAEVKVARPSEHAV